MLQKIREALLGEISNLYRMVLGFAVLAVSVIVIVEAIMQYEEYGLMVLVILLVYLLVLFVCANAFTNSVKKIFPYIMLPINLLIFPFMFLFAEGGGIKSGMPVWMTMGILALFIVADGRSFWLQLGLSLLVDAGMFYYLYLNPEQVNEIENEAYYYQDNFVAICVASFSIGLIGMCQRRISQAQSSATKEALAHAKQEQKNAQRADEEKNKLLESLSHEVRTPLNAIVGMSDMAAFHIDDKEKVQECLEKINESSAQVLTLINDLLDKAKLETRSAVLTPSHESQGDIYKNEDGSLVMDAYGRRILVVEDNEVNMEIVCSILERTHAEVVCAWTGEEATELFEESQDGDFDLILLDIQLPEMDGYEVARTIRSLNRQDALQVPIIAMTADVMAHDVTRAMESGMDDHIAKPLDIEELFRKISKAFHRDTIKETEKDE